MKIEFRELISNGYTLRGLFSKPESEYKDLVACCMDLLVTKMKMGIYLSNLLRH